MILVEKNLKKQTFYMMILVEWEKIKFEDECGCGERTLPRYLHHRRTSRRTRGCPYT